MLLNRFYPPVLKMTTIADIPAVCLQTCSLYRDWYHVSSKYLWESHDTSVIISPSPNPDHGSQHGFIVLFHEHDPTFISVCLFIISAFISAPSSHRTQTVLKGRVGMFCVGSTSVSSLRDYSPRASVSPSAFRDLIQPQRRLWLIPELKDAGSS